MPSLDYSKFYAPKGQSYSTTVKGSYYNTPIDRSPGRPAGNSRIWGDASEETQKASIDAIIAAAEARGLSTRETAHVLAIAHHESGFNPDAAAGTTSASGLGQFIDKTGKHYNLDTDSRWNTKAQAEALVSHFIDNRDLAAKRGVGEEYIYKFHHDGPTGEYKGLELSQQHVMPLIDGYEAALKERAAPQPANTQASTPKTQSPSQKEQKENIVAKEGTYSIAKDDTLSKIAARHGVSQEELAKANGITDPNRIRAGQTLMIPGQGKQGTDLLETNFTTQTGGPADEAERTETAIDAAKPEDAPEQTANIDPRIQAMREMAAQPIDHPGRAALLKPVETWTEAEMKDVLNSAQGDFTGRKSGDPLRARMYEAVQDWHTNTYGDQPQQLDGGKPVEPSPVKPVNTVTMPHATPQGEDLWQAAADIGDRIGTVAEADGYSPSVKAIQRGINMLTESLDPPERSPAWGPYTAQPPLTVDGVYGPKTDFALKDTLARHGTAKTDDALALGRFGNFADQVKQSGNADGLENAVTSIFGPLYGGSDAPKGVLQETLNTVGDDNSIYGWEPLKEDDWIGPKTTDAFARVIDQADPEDVTRRFGQGLGLL